MEYCNLTADPSERWELRARAVQAVMKGEKRSHVARRHGITRQTLYNWVTKHRLGGMKALAVKPRGRVRCRVLESWQEAQIVGAIRILSPRTVNPRYTRWTKKAIVEYVERSFGIPFSAWQVDRHLRRWGFGSQKEARRAFKNCHTRDDVPGWSPQPRDVATTG